MINQRLYHYTYYLWGYFVEHQDPRTKNYPLVSLSPYSIALIMYFYYLLVTKIGRKFMKNRQPFQLRKTMFIYNIIMVIINAYYFYEAISYCDYLRVFLNFDYPDSSDRSPETIRAINLGWWYWMSKFADWFDTFFYVLRKKHEHINFLHLYHHISVPVFGYLLIKINPMVPSAHIFIIMNTFVHCCMYSYYALAALGPKIQRYLWWKRYITVMQLAQFIIGMIYGLFVVKFQRGYPFIWMIIGLTQPPFFFYMFYGFYRRAYDNRTKLNSMKNASDKRYENSSTIINDKSKEIEKFD
ncbi:Elongation of very long chain fatty acids protein 7 [Dermatophagoides pteronyssinus]|uniref:Elongation of very long chain fatty acids protein n=1 Tax=Dermatophagoides pteronyssinus TaxID=6956 RepID=A0ABQ8JBQ0_DERPT|nr:Elongation of very long chain fatty acids protein 7 [Dermatophagoides pteronyssinus]